MMILHWEKYRNFICFPGVEILQKGTVSTPGNQVKLRYFSQCYDTHFVHFFIYIFIHIINEKIMIECTLTNIQSCDKIYILTLSAFCV